MGDPANSDDSISDEIRKDVAPARKMSHQTLPGHGNVSNTRTLMNFLRGMIGPGCLALPIAFKEAGLWVGFVMILIMGFLNAYCMMLLVKCSQFLCEKTSTISLDYGHVVKKAFDYGPERLRKYSRIPLYLTNGAIGGMQIGIGSVLLVFMATHIQEILPMENKMADPKAMRGWNGILYTGMASISSLYAASGFFGYLAYGDGVKASVAENLPKSVINDVVKGLLVLSFYVSYGIQLYVVIEMLWPAIKRKILTSFSDGLQLAAEFAFRILIVLTTFCLAVAIPNLAEIIPLVGITCGMTLAFIIPPILDTVTFWKEWEAMHMNRKWIIGLKLVRNGSLLALGLFGLIAGLTFNIQKIAG